MFYGKILIFGTRFTGITMVVLGDHLLCVVSMENHKMYQDSYNPTHFCEYTKNKIPEKSIQNVFLVNFNSNVETEQFTFMERN